MLASLLAAGVAAASVSVTAQSPAMAASCVASSSNGIWHVPSGCFSVPVPGAHHCQVIGTSTTSAGTTQAVECADVYASNASGAHQLWGEGKFYCQGVYVQCLGMNVAVGFDVVVNGGNPEYTPVSYYKCNPDVGLCPDGSPAMVATAHIGIDSANAKNGVATGSTDFADEAISVNGAGAAYHSKTNLNSIPVIVAFNS